MSSIPGRGRRGAATSHLAVRLDLLCDRGHKVGTAWRDLDDRGLHVSRVTWTDTPTGGKVEGRCECGAHPRFRWSRVVEALDAAEAEARPTSALRP